VSLRAQSAYDAILDRLSIALFKRRQREKFEDLMRSGDTATAEAVLRAPAQNLHPRGVAGGRSRPKIAVSGGSWWKYGGGKKVRNTEQSSIAK
jgi:hypothetical protein